MVGAVRDTGTRARTGLLLVVFQKKAGPQSTALLSLSPPSLRLNEQVWGGGRVSGLPCADPRALGQMPEKVRPLSQIQGAVRVFSGYGEGGWSVLGLSNLRPIAPPPGASRLQSPLGLYVMLV